MRTPRAPWWVAVSESVSRGVSRRPTAGPACCCMGAGVPRTCLVAAGFARCCPRRAGRCWLLSRAVLRRHAANPCPAPAAPPPSLPAELLHRCLSVLLPEGRGGVSGARWVAWRICGWVAVQRPHRPAAAGPWLCRLRQHGRKQQAGWCCGGVPKPAGPPCPGARAMPSLAGLCVVRLVGRARRIAQQVARGTLGASESILFRGAPPAPACSARQSVIVSVVS
jgi:hypothetical protein